MKKRILPFLAMLSSVAFLAQTYNNGPIVTGTTSTNGTAAPAGYSWSELDTSTGNSTLGSGGAGGFLLADDFTVPTGEKWTINDVHVFGYQTSATAMPFTALSMQIYNGSPLGGGTVIHGDTSTNTFVSGSEAMAYRISPSGVNTNRKIWDVKGAFTSSVSLVPGTYFLSFGVTASGSTSGFFPPVTILGQTAPAGANGEQYTPSSASWGILADGGSGAPQAVPFVINYSVESFGTSEVREFDSRVVAYPNPTVDSFKLNLPESAAGKVSSVELFDMSGKLVKAFKASDSYNVSELGKGVYLIKVKVGDVVKALRIVKH